MPFLASIGLSCVLSWILLYRAKTDYIKNVKEIFWLIRGHTFRCLGIGKIIFFTHFCVFRNQFLSEEKNHLNKRAQAKLELGMQKRLSRFSILLLAFICQTFSSKEWKIKLLAEYIGGFLKFPWGIHIALPVRPSQASMTQAAQLLGKWSRTQCASIWPSQAEHGPADMHGCLGHTYCHIVARKQGFACCLADDGVARIASLGLSP